MLTATETEQPTEQVIEEIPERTEPASSEAETDLEPILTEEYQDYNEYSENHNFLKQGQTLPFIRYGFSYTCLGPLHAFRVICVNIVFFRTAKSDFINLIQRGMDQTIVGQKHLIDSLLIALLSNGHVLLYNLFRPMFIRSLLRCKFKNSNNYSVKTDC